MYEINAALSGVPIGACDICIPVRHPRFGGGTRTGSERVKLFEDASLSLVKALAKNPYMTSLSLREEAADVSSTGSWCVCVEALLRDVMNGTGAFPSLQRLSLMFCLRKLLARSNELATLDLRDIRVPPLLHSFAMEPTACWCSLDPRVLRSPYEAYHHPHIDAEIRGALARAIVGNVRHQTTARAVVLTAAFRRSNAGSAFQDSIVSLLPEILTLAAEDGLEKRLPVPSRQFLGRLMVSRYVRALTAEHIPSTIVLRDTSTSVAASASSASLRSASSTRQPASSTHHGSDAPDLIACALNEWAPAKDRYDRDDDDDDTNSEDDHDDDEDDDMNSDDDHDAARLDDTSIAQTHARHSPFVS